MSTEQEDFVWSVTEGVVTLNGHIVLIMPLREGAVPGREYSASCTLCRFQQTAAGMQRGGGDIGFFRNRDHADMMTNIHVQNHKKKGEVVHIVNLPAREPASTQKENVSGKR